jgi:citrate lyase subunit beta/citryl-CoA lyase
VDSSTTWGPALLFCPADRPDRYAKALAAADAVVIDLEDAVGDNAKDEARQTLRDAAQWLPPERTVVRINALGTCWSAADLAMLNGTPLRNVMVPKAADPEAIAALAPLQVVALCETARGVLAAPELAEVGNCTALFWGGEDLIADIGGWRSRRDDGTYLPVVVHARTAVLLAAAAAGKPAWDGVYLAIDDLAGLAAECAEAVDMGFAAKVAIHPSHAAVIRRSFAPTDQQVEWAQALLAAAAQTSGVSRFRGRMIDGPLVAQARAVLARAAQPDPGGPPSPGTPPDHS